jgi:hypothetical protein
MLRHISSLLVGNVVTHDKISIACFILTAPAQGSKLLPSGRKPIKHWPSRSGRAEYGVAGFE